MRSSVFGGGRSAASSPPGLCVSTHPQPASLDCQVVFQSQDEQGKEAETSNSPFHHGGARFHTPVPGSNQMKVFSKGFLKDKNTASARNLHAIENKLLSVVSQGGSQGSLAPSERPITAQKLLRAFRNPVDPDNPEARKRFEEFQNRARRLLQVGDDLNAETCLNVVHKLCPENADTFFNLGTIEHFFRNDIENAKHFYQLALDQDENHISTLLNLASVDLWQGNKRACESHLRDVLFVDKKNCDAMCNLGILYSSDNEQAAETWFKKVLDVDPAHETTLFNYGTLLCWWGKPEGKVYLKRCSNPSLARRAVVTHSIAYPNIETIRRARAVRKESSSSSSISSLSPSASHRSMSLHVSGSPRQESTAESTAGSAASGFPAGPRDFRRSRSKSEMMPKTGIRR